MVRGGTGTGLVAAGPGEILRHIARRLSFGDALVASSVESWAGEAQAFVSWDARHFRSDLAARLDPGGVSGGSLRRPATATPW